MLEVPGEFPTISDAVAAAQPGDLVLISPGVYNEAVDVTTDDIVIRGLEREGVVLDGQFELDNGIRVLGANGVAVENLTTQNYTVNVPYTVQVEQTYTVNCPVTQQRTGTRMVTQRVPVTRHRTVCRDEGSYQCVTEAVSGCGGAGCGPADGAVEGDGGSGVAIADSNGC